MRRRLTSLLLRGPHAEMIASDLDEIYRRERARGLSFARAQLRYVRRLIQSAFAVWRGESLWLVGESQLAGTSGGGSMLQDLRFALRLSRKNPLPVTIAIGGLALAIGVVSSVFTIVDNTMLKPYGMDDPASVYSVGSTQMHGWSEWRYSTFLRMRDDASTARVEASLWRRVLFSHAPAAEPASSRDALFVSGGYLNVLGGKPALGRPLGPADDTPGAPVVGVVSHHFWATELNSDTSMVGKPLWINDKAVEIVGVLQPDFSGPVHARPSFWIPFAAVDDLVGGTPFDEQSPRTVDVIARLAPGVAAFQAEENLSAIAGRAAVASGQSADRTPRSLVQMFGASSPIDGRDASESFIAIICIFGITGLVLAVACANTANLLLASTTVRRHEMGVRLSLGASTKRLIRQMLNESLVLAMVAGGLGLIFSFWLAPLLGAALTLPPETSTTPDIRAVAVTLFVALICGLGAGLSPARYGAGGNLFGALKSQSGQAGVARSRLRTSFVGFQAAVSMFLLVAAGLFVRTTMVVTQTDIGFDADRVLTVSLGGTRAGFDEAAYVNAAKAKLENLPSVERVSVTEHLPWGWSLHRVRFDHAGSSYQVNVNKSDEQFMQTTGVRVLRGRPFTADEVAQAAPVALVSESLAQAFFGDANPIGQPLSVMPAPDFSENPATIVGVVNDAMLTSFDAEVYGSVYRPIRKLAAGTARPVSPPGFVVRTSNPARASREVSEALRPLHARLQPELSIVRERVDSFLANKKMFAWLSAPIAGLVLLLSALGMFGVCGFIATQRLQEVSVRMAMGASGSDIKRLLFRDGVRPAAIGLCAGLFAALLAANYTARAFNLSGISPFDPLAIGLSLAVLGAATLLAVLVPAFRASRANPAELLRQT